MSNKLLVFIFNLVFINLFNIQSANAQYTQNFAANFNGTNAYIAVPPNSDLNPTTAITVEAWIYPTALPSTSACIIGKNYLTSYYFGIENSGRFIFFPRNQAGGFLRSRVSGKVKVNQWTHIAGTYDGTTTRLYINGVLDTSRTGITGNVGSNFDSLYIGADRLSGATSFFFNGRLDNVRIWKSARTAVEISNNMYIPLNIYQLSGAYSFLSASYQLDNSALDLSGPVTNNGYERNISYIDYTNKSVNHIDYNNNLVVNGSTDYCSHYNIGEVVNPSIAVTLECWIKRDTTNANPFVQNVFNKSGGATRYSYALFIYNTGHVIFAINNGNFNIQSLGLITNAQWTHIAGTYNSSTGKAVLYVNGDSVVGTNFPGNPLIDINNSDSLFFGGIGATSFSGSKFRGQLDEVRLWRTARSREQIKNFMYKHPASFTNNDSLINFDFDYLHSGFRLDQTLYNYGLVYRGGAFINTAHPNSNLLSSPMLSSPDTKFYDSAFTMNSKKFFVPDANATGIKDSIFISGGHLVNNLKLFLLMSHTYTSDMDLSLTSPSGTTISLMYRKGGNSNDVMTIFSDDADSISASGFSILNGPGITPPFSPLVKPDQALSALNGQSSSGWWKLKLIDLAGSDRGYVHGWGINLKPKKTLDITVLIQGFYNSTENKLTSDTARAYLRIPLPPYPVFDSSKAVLDSNGNSKFNFTKLNNGYLVIRHRNSIETWTPAPRPFNADSTTYDFTTSLSKAYGSNQIKVDSLPDKFAFYSGDVNQDATIDVGDIIEIYNDGLNFVSGYVRTDVNGDDFIDVADLVIAYNNSINFVSVIRP